MKRLKKLLLIMMCVGILVSVTACAGNSNDNGAGQNDVVNDNGANDTQTGDSAMDKIGDGLEDGIDDVGKGVVTTRSVLRPPSRPSTPSSRLSPRFASGT